MSNLYNFVDIPETSVNAIKTFGLTNLADFLLFSLALNNLDSSTKTAFENKRTSDAIPTYDDLIKFVIQEVRGKEISDNPVRDDKSTLKPKITRSDVLIGSSSSSTRSSSSNVKSTTCPKCKTFHISALLLLV